MIKEYYPRTDSSLANSITMCVRAWVDEGVESFHTEEKRKTYSYIHRYNMWI